ncbi:MAG: hypothetical protein IKW02_04100 [Clostridia bacterium]|nr:hypothetical protein [Clostridia bacterium]
MKDLTKGNIYKNFILFAIPLVLSGLLTQAFNVINGMLSGKYLGEAGLAATGSTASFFQLYGSFFWGWGMGFSIYIAKLFGEKNYSKLRNSIYISIIAFMILSVVSSVLMIIFKKPIFALLKVDFEIYHDASSYYTILLSAYFLITLNSWAISILSSLGITGYPFIVSLCTTLVYTLLKYIILEYCGGGLASIAVLSLFAALSRNLLYGIKLRECFREMKVSKEKVSLDMGILKETVGYSFPVVFQQISMYFASFFIAPLVNGFGNAATASYSVILTIQNLSASVYQNSAKTVSSYSAQCLGTREFHKFKKGVGVGFLQGMAFVLPIVVLCSVFADKLCGMYFDTPSGQAFEFATIFVRYFLPFILFNMINNLFHSFFRGVAAMNLLVICTLFGAISRYVATILLTPHFDYYGVFIGWVASWIAEAVFVTILYYSGVWKKEKVNKLKGL